MSEQRSSADEAIRAEYERKRVGGTISFSTPKPTPAAKRINAWIRGQPEPAPQEGEPHIRFDRDGHIIEDAT